MSSRPMATIVMSSQAWPMLRDGLDATTVVSDRHATATTAELESL